jgi:hypothetical protein
MSSSTAAGSASPVRRVRHEVRDSLAVMIFSALTSCVVALLLMLAVRLSS